MWNGIGERISMHNCFLPTISSRNRIEMIPAGKSERQFRAEYNLKHMDQVVCRDYGNIQITGSPSETIKGCAAKTDKQAIIKTSDKSNKS
jgi:hypothetical protein